MTRPTPRQIQMLKHKLRVQRQSLIDEASEELARWSEHPMGELAGEAPDTGDDSVASLITDLDHSALQRLVAAISDIDAALSRMHDKRYATCADCGDDIAFQRLSAFPAAMRCVSCESRREKAFAHGAMHTL